MKSLFNHSLMRYLLVGLTTLAVDYSILITCYRLLHVPLVVAATIGFVVGLVANFLFNKFWTFQTSHDARASLRQGLLYAALLGVNLVFTDVFVWLLASAHIEPEVSKLAASACIAAWNYVLYRTVIFKHHKRTDASRSIM